MAIATLELVFQNPRIFETNVKITKGETAQLLMESSQNLRTVCAVFKRYIRRIYKKNTPKDPNFLNLSIACSKDEQFIESIYLSQDPKVLGQLSKDGGSGVVVTDKAKAIDDQAKSDAFHLLLTVLGTLFFISAIMVSRHSVSRHNLLTLIKIGTAYWAGVRFDVALKEFTKGNIFPDKEKILDTQQGNVIGGHPIAHGEL